MKKEILQLCRQLIADKIKSIDDKMSELQDSANTDTKSSMGDKYETSRAMIQLEQENLYTRKNQLLEQAQVLNRLSVEKMNQVQPGALITTSAGKFYISVGLGKLEMADQTLFAVSADSPIAQQMMGKSKDDCYEINGNSFRIQEIQ